MKAKDIVIVGTGGLAREVKGLIDDINQHENQWNLLGFIDNWGKQKGDVIIDDKSVVGTIGDLNKMAGEIHVTIAIAGKIAWKKEAISLITNPNVQFPNLIHPSALIRQDIKTGKGNIICSYSTMSCNVTIGDFNFFNSYYSVGHDAQIGSYNVFGPKAIISGNVTIGSDNFFGLNSSVLEGKSIGNNNRIGACSFIMRNVKDDCFYFGVPAKRMKI